MAYDERKEVDEAINAANDALFHLDRAAGLLNSSKNWGVLDILGGGLFISLIKRSKMKDASRAISDARNSLYKLNTELSDIRGFDSYDLDFDGVMAFGDIWADNAIFDLMTQSRINKAASAVNEMIAEIEGLLDGLEEIKTRLG